MNQDKAKEAGNNPASSAPDLSVVVPIFNEADNVLPLHAALTHSLQELGRSYELVYVDDGSRDGSIGQLLGLHRRDGHVTVVKLRNNFGQTAALAAGFEYARGRVVITMDGDLQNDPADIRRLLYRLESGFDVVCGWRRNRQDGWLLRLLPSHAANWIIARITGVRIHDTGCTLKAYRGWVVKSMVLYSDMHRFIPALAVSVGARVTEISVRHHRRRYGISKYGISRVLRVAFDLLVVKMVASFAAHPIRGFALVSLPILFLGALFFGLGLVLFSFAGKEDPALLDRWDLGYMTCSVVLLMMATNLFLLGLLSELAVKASGFFRKAACPVVEEQQG